MNYLQSLKTDKKAPNRNPGAFVKSKNKSNIITELNNSTNLFEQGYLDSFGLVELILMVEKKFKINISNIII